MRFRTASAAALFLSLFIFGTVSAQEIKVGTISGRVMIKDGEPMAGGVVFLFNDASGPPPSRYKYWRVPDNVIPIGEEGKFSAEVTPGKYYLGARKAVRESSGKDIGPPREGDHFIASEGEKGLPRQYIVSEGVKTDIGILTGAKPFSRSAVNLQSGITAIRGTVLGPDDKPVEGALVFAFISPTMVGRPLFASDRTDKEGKYILRVSGAGSYYLRVRSLYGGGPPVTGEMVGDYGEREPAAVAIKAEETIEGINIKVKKFSGRGPKAGQGITDGVRPPGVPPDSFRRGLK